MESVSPALEVRQLLKEDLRQVRELALLKIFPITYEEIVVPEQIDYMMELFYTPENLLQQFESGSGFFSSFMQKIKRPVMHLIRHSINRENFKLNKKFM